MNSKGLSSIAKRYPMLASTLFACLLGVFAINRQSFWMDELDTWYLTQIDEFWPWLDRLVQWKDSNAQWPIYHLYLWIWAKFSPQDEVGLRLSNLPWLIVMFYPLLTAPVAKRSVLLVHTMSLVFLFHPLIWYYVNQQRPYIMLLAGATLAGVGFLGQWFPAKSKSEAEVANNFLIIGLALMWVTSPIGAIWTIAFLAPAWWVMFKRNGVALGISRQNVVLLIACTLLMLPVTYYYVSTFLNGITAVTIYEPKIANFMFGFYEIFGASGLGPGREELRETVGKALLRYTLPLVVYSVVVLAVFAYGMLELLRTEKNRAILLIAFSLLPVVVLFTLGEVKHWRVVGRHMMPLLFFFALILAQGLLWLWQSGSGSNRRNKLFGKLLAILALVAMLGSSLSLTFGERHSHEMYKKAAAYARQGIAQGGIVWWLADDLGIKYYGLGSHLVSDCHEAKPGTLVLISNPLSKELDGCARPYAALMSRQEIYDRNGVGQSMLINFGLKKREQFIGFEYWQ